MSSIVGSPESSENERFLGGGPRAMPSDSNVMLVSSRVTESRDLRSFRTPRCQTYVAYCQTGTFQLNISLFPLVVHLKYGCTPN